MLVLDAGEHAHGGPVGLPQHVAQAVEAVRVRQAQVEQHTVGVAEPGPRVSHRLRDLHVERGLRLREQLTDEERVARVVLHEQHADALPGRGSDPPVAQIQRRADVGHAHTHLTGPGTCRAAYRVSLSIEPVDRLRPCTGSRMSSD
jgi:hypothetical protein